MVSRGGLVSEGHESSFVSHKGCEVFGGLFNLKVCLNPPVENWNGWYRRARGRGRGCASGEGASPVAGEADCGESAVENEHSIS